MKKTIDLSVLYIVMSAVSFMRQRLRGEGRTLPVKGFAVFAFYHIAGVEVDHLVGRDDDALFHGAFFNLEGVSRWIIYIYIYNKKKTNIP